MSWVLFGTLCIELLAFLVTGVFIVVGIKIAICIYAVHVVHCRGNSSLDACVDSSCIKCQTAPSANADNTDTFRVNIRLSGEKIDGSLKIFRVDIR